MGYHISRLKSFPQIFNWYFFLVGSDHCHSPIADFFSKDFASIAYSLGEKSAIINFNRDIDEELARCFHKGKFNNFNIALSNLEYNTPGLLLMDNRAITCITHTSIFSVRNHLDGNAYFIPFEALEKAYSSLNTLFRDIISFGLGKNTDLLCKTQDVPMESDVESSVSHFNYTWAPSLLYASQKSHLSPVHDWNDEIHQKTMQALTTLASNPRYWLNHENDINDVVRDLLNMVFHVYDQTRKGFSSSGEGAGYLDFEIRDDCNLPIAIIEALSMDYLNKSDLRKHIMKALTKYDLLGLPICSILIYGKCKNFDQFWTNQKEYVNTLEIPFPVTGDMTEDAARYANLRHAFTTIDRNGFPTLFHIYAVHLDK